MQSIMCHSAVMLVYDPASQYEALQLQSKNGHHFYRETSAIVLTLVEKLENSCALNEEL